MAVGATQVVEMVNQTGQVYPKGSSPTASTPSFSLKAFFSMSSIDPNYVATDPRVLYDSSTGRWYASMLGFLPTSGDPTLVYDSTVFLAVSRSSDATGTWAVYAVYYGYHQNGNGNSLLCDQPKLGYSGDKFDLACTDFADTNAYYGGVGIVTSKSQGLAARTMTVGVAGPFNDVFGVVPAQNLGAENPVYMVENRTNGPAPAPDARVWVTTGDPAAGLGGVFLDSVNVPITATTIPPKAVQQAR